MKSRTLIVSILGILVVASALLAENAGVPDQEPQEPAIRQSDSPELQPGSSFEAPATSVPRPKATRTQQLNPTPAARPMPTRVRPPYASESPKKLMIFELKYARAVDMYVMIYEVFGIQTHSDGRLNRLIVNATEEQIESVKSLIEALDVADPKASTPQDIQSFVYRVYMFEVPTGNQNMRSFSLILQTPAQVSSKELSVAAADKDLQISDYLHINHDLSEPQAEILIRGRAVSDDAFKRFFEKFPESHITELKWEDDETFTDNIAAAQYTQLPEQMQKHIRKFLGDDIRTVGYWFGSLSVPGEVKAPIGPWTLNLQLDIESDRMLELNVEVEVPTEMHRFDRRLGREQKDEILSNMIRVKIGKPIIIGYNRESYGTRKMGVMLILPEEDKAQLNASGTNSLF